ncbi:13110_t:CDS:2, partial [Ambispora gerdemannii]
MSWLPSDILDEIFQHLAALGNPFDQHSPEIYNNLYTCILVNKQWCNIAIPHLWRHPFTSVRSHVQYKILKIYLSLLDKSKQEKIKNELGFKFSYLSTPTFNYASFLRHLDYAELISAIRSFHFISMEDEIFEENIIFMIFDLIRELFVTSGSRLISLRVTLCDSLECLAGFYDPNFRNWISGIHNLYVVGLNEETCPSLQILAKDCKYLRNLSISAWHFETNNKSQILEDYIVDFLNSQRNLKNLSIFSCSGITQLIMQALKSCSSSLEHLSLENLDFDRCTKWDNFNTFNNLNKLTILDCFNLPPEMVHALLNCKFSKLWRVNLQEKSSLFLYPEELLNWANRVNAMNPEFNNLRQIEDSDPRVW